MSSGHNRYTKHSVCTNCGEQGHHFRSCTAPVTSYGIIAFRTPTTWNQVATLAKSDSEATGLPAQGPEMLLIQRRDSIGYVELLRAKYKLTEVEYIKKQISGITAEERQKLLTLSFQDLWIGLWGSNSGETRQYKQEYEQAKAKFESLREGYDQGGVVVSFKSLFDSLPVLWDTPEWGFPKGRRNAGESDFDCAMREFQEETGLVKGQYCILENVNTFQEDFYGNNGIHYRHIYYVASVSPTVKVELNKLNEVMNREVGSIQWFSMEAALNRIRPTNVEKRQILQCIQSLLRNTCPLLIGFSETAEQSVRKEGENTNRKPGNECNPWQQRLVRIGGGSGTSTSTTADESNATFATRRNPRREPFSFLEDSE